MRLTLKDQHGKELDIYISGSEPEDLDIGDAYYLDDHDKVVSDDTIQYIKDTYYDKIIQEWIEYQSAQAEVAWERYMDR